MVSHDHRVKVSNRFLAARTWGGDKMARGGREKKKKVFFFFSCPLPPSPSPHFVSSPGLHGQKSITKISMGEIQKSNVFYCSGADPEISERGGGDRSQILERGGQNSTFQCGFQSFSYKSLINIPPKGGLQPVRPLP